MRGSMRVAPLRAAVLGAIFAAVVTLPGLGEGTLWDNSETTYGEVAREVGLMHDWIVMHLNGVPWFVQPPLYFWIGQVFVQWFGPTAFALRLPSALATIAMGAATGYATARVAGLRAGVVAAMILSTSLMQAIVGRLAIMDALLDACVTIAILAWFRAFSADDRRLASPAARRVAFLGGSFALGLGTLAKGPVAPAIVVLVIAVWLGWERRRWSALGGPGGLTVVAGAAVYVAVVVPWFAAEATRAGAGGLRELLLHYTVGRYTGVIENQSGPWWYYLPVIVLGFFPWTAFLPCGFVAAFAAAGRPEGALARLSIVWTIVPLLFFSCAQTKLPNYVALLLPALAIVSALWFERVARGEEQRAAVLSAASIPLFVAALALAVGVFLRTNRLESATTTLLPAFAVLGVVMLAGSIATVLALGVPRFTAVAPYVLGATATALVLFIAFVAVPAAEAYKPIPPLARAIEARRSDEGVVALRGASGGPALLFYTQPGVVQLENDLPAFEHFACGVRQGFIVTRATDGDALVAAARARGRRAAAIAASGRLTLIEIDGPPCAPG
jgi:4-amino-4-deoxy-L-arabinose transferase-like glycosyltransferase